MIVAIDVSDVTSACETLLKNSPLVGEDGYDVDVAEAPPENLGEKGWVGIYRTRMQCPSRTLGAGAGHRNQRIEMAFMVRESDGTSGKECQARLDLLVKRVLSVLLTDASFGGTVTMLDEVEVQYNDYTKGDTGIFLQQALIFITGLEPVAVNS
jgi:hypothetical protein